MIEWGKIWVKDFDRRRTLQVIRVENGVANALSATVWLRRPVGDNIAPGFYTMGFGNKLVAKSIAPNVDYPDLELKKQYLVNPVSLCLLSNEIIADLLRFTENVSSDASVYISAKGILTFGWRTPEEIKKEIRELNPEDYETLSEYEEDLNDLKKELSSVVFYQLPIKTELPHSLSFVCSDLRIALGEACYYSNHEVQLMRSQFDNVAIIGTSSDSCTVISSRKGYLL